MRSSGPYALRLTGAVLLGSLLTSTAGVAQTGAYPTLINCASFNAFGGKGARQLMGIGIIPKNATVDGHTARGGKWISGEFRFVTSKDSQIIAIWSNLSSDKALVFSTQRGEAAWFKPGYLSNPVSVVSGLIAEVPAGFHAQEVEGTLVCRPVQNPPGQWTLAPVRIIASPEHLPSTVDKKPKPPITDVLKKLGTLQAEKQEKESSDAGASADAGKPATEGPGKHAAIDTGRSPAPKPSAELRPKPDMSLICRAGEAHSLTLPSNFPAGSESFAVGLRNETIEARGFDYIRVSGGDIVPRDFVLDIASSARKLLVYDPVAPPSRLSLEGTEVDVLPVSIPGLDRSKWQPVNPGGAKPLVTLNIVVVGAPEEIAISGLDAVGKSLEKKTRAKIGVSVEWYNVTAAGELEPPVKFDSFQGLVEAASKIAQEQFVVLDRDAFSKFISNFRKILTDRSDSVDRVFWIKSAYKLHSEAPKQIEDFLMEASSSPAIPRLPRGEPEKWLTVVTARIPGFSVAYLKEPIYSINVGEVIDEPPDNRGDPRRLIVDPDIVALALQGVGAIRTSEKGSLESPAEPLVSDLLVLNGNQIFAEQGYVISGGAIDLLVERLGKLAALWSAPDSTSINIEALQALVANTGVSVPSIINVLQSDALSGFKLQAFPTWVRTPLESLSSDESLKARDFVRELLAKMQSLQASRQERAENENKPICGLVYVRDADLGLKSDSW